MTTDTQLTYLTDMQTKVNEYLDKHADEGVVSAEAAAELITMYPKLVNGWLMARAPAILTEYVTTVSRSRGARLSLSKLQSRFASFAAQHTAALASGNTAAAHQSASEFFLFHEVHEGERKVRKPLYSLDATQVSEVSARYTQRAEENRFKAAVMDRIAEKVAEAGPGKVVGDLWTPDQIDKLFN